MKLKSVTGTITMLMLTSILTGCIGDNNTQKSRKIAAKSTYDYDILGAPVFNNGINGPAVPSSDDTCLNLNNFNLEIPATVDALSVQKSLYYTKDKTTAISGLTTNSSVKASYGLFNGYLNVMTSNFSELGENQMRFVYNVNISAPLKISQKQSMSGKKNMLTIDGYDMFLASPTRFLDSCGYSYVDSMRIGTTTTYELILTFKDSSEKNSFAIAAGAAYGNLAQLATEISTFSEVSEKSLVVSITGTTQGIAISPTGNFQETKLIPKIPAECTNASSMDLCVEKLNNEVENTTSSTLQTIQAIASWISSNNDKPWDERKQKFQGLKALPNTGTIDTYTRPYSSDYITTNKDLAKLQNRIFSAVDEMKSALGFLDNVIPLLINWNIGQDDNEFQNKLSDLRSARKYISKFADALAANLSSNHSGLAISCFQKGKYNTCKEYFDDEAFLEDGKPLGEVLDELQSIYARIKLYAGGQYYYTKNHTNNTMGDLGYLGLSGFNIEQFFPVLLNNRTTRDTPFYTRFLSPQEPRRKYLNIAYNPYHAEISLNKEFTIATFNIKLAPNYLKTINVSCKTKQYIIEEDAYKIDCSQEIGNTLLSAHGIAIDNIKDLYFDPEAFVFYVPQTNEDTYELFSHLHYDTMARSKFHDIANITYGSLHSDGNPSAILITGDRWYSANGNYYLTLEKVNGGNSSLSYVLKLVDKRDPLSGKVRFITPSEPIRYMQISKSGNVIRLNFYNNNDAEIKGTTISILDMMETLNSKIEDININLVITNDFKLGVVNNLQSVSGSFPSYKLGENYSTFMDMVINSTAGISTSYGDFKFLDVTPMVFK